MPESRLPLLSQAVFAPWYVSVVLRQMLLTDYIYKRKCYFHATVVNVAGSAADSAVHSTSAFGTSLHVACTRWSIKPARCLLCHWLT